MKTPAEIMARAAADDRYARNTDEYREAYWSMNSDALIAAERVRIAALEAAGYVIAHPDQEEIGMVFDAILELPPSDPRPTIAQIRAALRAAPQWSKGSEG